MAKTESNPPKMLASRRLPPFALTLLWGKLFFGPDKNMTSEQAADQLRRSIKPRAITRA
jgi:hypothetical protein